MRIRTVLRTTVTLLAGLLLLLPMVVQARPVEPPTRPILSVPAGPPRPLLPPQLSQAAEMPRPVRSAGMPRSVRPASISPELCAIEGVLWDPTHAHVPGGWIALLDGRGQSWSTRSDGFGQFAFTGLPTGTYALAGFPPLLSPYAATEPYFIELLDGQTTLASITLTTPLVSGQVLDCAMGQPIADAHVLVHDDGWTVERRDDTDMNGTFKIGGVLTPGLTYTLDIQPPEGSQYAPGGPYTIVPTATGLVLTMCAVPLNVIGVVQDSLGQPLAGARVFAYSDSYWNTTASDELGNFGFSGLPIGTLLVQAFPPWDRPLLLPSSPITVTIVDPQGLIDLGAITLPSTPKLVVGLVLDEASGQPIDGASVVAWQLGGAGYATTDAYNGQFMLGLDSGEWAVGVEPLSYPSPWVFYGPPEWVSFAPDRQAETATVTLTVTLADAAIHGHIACPGDWSCSGGPPPESIWVELSDQEVWNGSSVDDSYYFTITMPAGWYDLSVFVGSRDLQGPQNVPVYLAPGQVAEIGDITLVARDAAIQGRVYDEMGDGVGMIPVAAWESSGNGWDRVWTDEDGYYTLTVVPGEWFVAAEPEPEQPYVLQQPPALVWLEPTQVITEVDFILTGVDAVILGAAYDAQTFEHLWGLEGWAWAARYTNADWEYFSDGPVWDGRFQLKARGGFPYRVHIEVPPQSEYVSGNSVPVWVEPGDVITLGVGLQPKDSVITGYLVDQLSGQPITGAWAEVWGWDPRGHWVGAGVDPATGRYELSVISGTWALRAWIDPASEYIADPRVVTVTVEQGMSTTQDLAAWPIDTSISGYVLDPDGVVMEGAQILVEGLSPLVGYYSTETTSDGSGYFEVWLPTGIYNVAASLPDEALADLGWLNPPRIEAITATAGAPVTGLELRFQNLDGLIRGTLVLAAPITPTESAYVWAWTDSGASVETAADFLQGVATFTLNVISGTTWHVGAVYEDWDNGWYFESAQADVWVDPATGEGYVELLLDGPWPLVEPLIESFDATVMQDFTLPDGTEIIIPPGALALSGTVTLYIFPTQQLRQEEGAPVLGFGYQMWATDEAGQEITQFNEDVTIILYYPPDDVLAAMGIDENTLTPAYYSTLLGHWVLTDNYVQNAETNALAFRVNHFTKFGTIPHSIEQYRVYLPIVIKNDL